MAACTALVAAVLLACSAAAAPHANATFNATFSVGSTFDSGEEIKASGIMYLDSSDIELMHDTWITPAWAEAEQVVGITFPDVGVPPWAQVTSARVLLCVAVS